VHALSDMVKARLMEPIVALTLEDAEPILAQVPLALVVCASQLIDGTYRDVLQTLAREKRTVPLLVVSLMSRDEECEAARRLGAADCVPRPLTCQEVQTVLNKVFKLTWAHRDLSRHGTSYLCLGNSDLAGFVAYSGRVFLGDVRCKSKIGRGQTS
jgi:DNA-binding response OmpR family regulator